MHAIQSQGTPTRTNHVHVTPPPSPLPNSDCHTPRLELAMFRAFFCSRSNSSRPVSVHLRRFVTLCLVFFLLLPTSPLSWVPTPDPKRCNVTLKNRPKFETQPCALCTSPFSSEMHSGRRPDLTGAKTIEVHHLLSGFLGSDPILRL